MSPTPSLPATSEQRLLAAIVFSDVVGFSARMETREAETLALLERDFASMRQFSSEHGGTVIKTTGDGLMLYFTSAVEALEWALKTQRHFAAQTAEAGEAHSLRHRIGVHLGDVFVGAGDVMGDGVNVAARVQAEAPSGGICISEVVYGVVKNKLKLDVVRLEPRKLKNINEAVQIYSVRLAPPRPQSGPFVGSAGSSVSPRVTPRAPEPRRGPLGWVALLVLVGGGSVFFAREYLAHQKNLASSEEVRGALGALVRAEDATATRSAGEPAAAPEEFDFLSMTTRVPAGRDGAAVSEAAVQRAREALVTLETWRLTALARYTEDRPLTVRPLNRAIQQSRRVFIDSRQQLCFAEGGAVRRMRWDELKADQQGAILASLLSSAPIPPPREVRRGAEAFAFMHGLPDLAAVLGQK